MRVSEHGLRQLARRLHVTLMDRGKRQPLEFADWNKLIIGIKNKISEARKLSAGSKKQYQIDLWSDAADHCEYMKDIWRNAVSHTRRSYSDTDALGAYERVREFMSFLAKSLKKIKRERF